MKKALLIAEDISELSELRAVAAELDAVEVEAMGPEDLQNIPALERFGLTRLYTSTSWSEDPAESLGKMLAELISGSGAELVLGVSRKRLKDVFARAAQILKSPLLTDCLSATWSDGELVVERPTLGGGYVENLVVKKFPTLLALQQRGRQISDLSGKAPEVVRLEGKFSGVRVPRLISSEAVSRSGVDLAKSRIIVSVGRGFKRKEDLKLAEELAKLLGGELACSRPIASDMGWMPEDRHVGLSGKWVSPSLYLAIGISGQVQHMVGVRNSRIIVAVNNDPSAPIHREADYSVVADLYEFIPALVRELKARSASPSG
ncbi:MAG: electron transfer flavoprotein subunit alpha/FixB family protein [Nitrososphaerota archaeon]